MSDEILALAGKLRVDAAQWSQGFKQAENVTKGSAASIENSFGKVQRAAQTAVRTMDEASARVAAASWASRRAAEQEVQALRAVESQARKTGAELRQPWRSWSRGNYPLGDR